MNAPRRAASLLALTAAFALAAAPARADVPADRLALASNAFDAGAQAYKAGQYLIAAEAFLKANELSPSPSLLFSAAQAYRRQFLAEPAPATLRRAVGLYRDYLKHDPSAKRREDAMQALATLAPFEARFAADAAPAPEGPPPGGPPAAGDPPREAREASSATRLLLTSAAEGAEVSIDGGPFLAAPVVVPVRPGPRHVSVRAPGYAGDQVMVDAIAGELVPRHLALIPRPAKLQVIGPGGARVLVDGRARATLPLPEPLAIEPGAHFVAVTMLGHKPFGQVVEARRDASLEIIASLPPTGQRIAAWSTLSVGAAGVVAAGVLTGLAISRQSTAEGLNQTLQTTPLSTSQRDRYNSALGARDDFAHAAEITGAVSAVTLAAGLWLFALDRPEIVPPSDERLKAPRTPSTQVELEVGILSVGVRGRF
jgi:PEGA domain